MKLNIGCGSRYLHGWENLDFRPVSPEVKPWDLRRRLPYPDGSVDLVYSSHLLEHLSPEQAAALLKDALRVLKPGGVVRMVVPDLETLARGYLEALREVRGRRSEDRGEPEVRGRRSEVGGQRTEGRGEREDCWGKAESRKQSSELASNRLEPATARSAATGNAEIETEDGGEKAESRKQKAEIETEDGGEKAESRKQKAENEQPAPGVNEEPRLVRRSLGEGGTKSQKLNAPGINEEPSTFNLQPSNLHPAPSLAERYDWSVIFLLDQLVRTRSGGAMLARLAEYGNEPPAFLRKCFNSEWLECVLGQGSACGARSDVRCQMSGGEGPSDLRPRNSDLGPQTSDLLGRIAPGLRWRWRVVMEALERALRKYCPGIADRLDCWRAARFLAQGERHQWMYDEWSMKRLMEDCGFVNVQRMTSGKTASPFGDELQRLDMTAAGEAYQPMSLYVEAVAPPVLGSPPMAGS